MNKEDKICCNEIRKTIVNEIFKCEEQNGHLGGCLSSVEIFYSIYKYSSNITSLNLNSIDRDRIILSKAHAGIAQYSTMAELGIISKQELLSMPIRGENTPFTRQPQKNIKYGLELTSGSLGLGPSYGCGLSLLFKQNKTNQKVFVILGDGECQEGSVWEAFMFAASNKLDNLFFIVDRNMLQLDGETNSIVNMDFLSKSVDAMGFYVKEVDGHDVSQISNELVVHKDRPTFIIAKTIKGKGISFCENNYKWHDNYLSNDLKNIAMEELSNAKF